MFLVVWEAERPRTVFVRFDDVGEPTYPNELLPEYTGRRTKRHGGRHGGARSSGTALCASSRGLRIKRGTV
jgi:hypothetical protein